MTSATLAQAFLLPASTEDHSFLWQVPSRLDPGAAHQAQQERPNSDSPQALLTAIWAGLAAMV